MAVKKITWRWLLNSFGVIVIIILIVEVLFAYGISRYYYNQVFQTLTSQANLINSTFDQYYSDRSADAFIKVRDYVASFTEKEQMELMTIGTNGHISLTSSGFEPDDKSVMDDYSMALESQDNIGQYVGQMGEDRVMAVTAISQVNDVDFAAVRLIVSLANVDRTIVFWIVAMVLLGIVILLTVLFSSSYFLNSIVNPVGEVSETARKIAQGNFGARLEKRTSDEIGELCDTINDMAEKLGEADRMKNDFISSVSHELRTPLTAIQGWGETILADDGNDKDMLSRGMNIIISETDRLSQMVEELLDFSRIQSGRFRLELDRMDVLAELSDVAIMYTDRATREGLALTYSDNDLIVPVNGDKNKLRQVFVNILDNAVKYSDPGGKIAIKAFLDGNMLTITVQDTGIGISQENLPQVKQKFFKVSSTRRSSGIGLAVADDIVTRHGGSLDIASQLGKGTKVTVKLPIMGSEESEK